MKNLSIPVNFCNFSLIYPRRNISATTKILSSLGLTTSFFNSSIRKLSIAGCSKLYRPISKERIPFKKADSKFSPIAIISPVAIILVPNLLSAFLNLSKGHFGILTTI